MSDRQSERSNLSTTQKTGIVTVVLFFLLGDSPASEFYVPKMEETGCSEKSAHIFQTPGNYPKERIQHSQQGEKFENKISNICVYLIFFTYFFLGK
jgi:hypothetical protein